MSSRDPNLGASDDPLTIGIAPVEACRDEPTHRIPTITPVRPENDTHNDDAPNTALRKVTPATGQERPAREPVRPPAPVILRALVATLALVTLVGVVGFVALQLKPSLFSSLSQKRPTSTTLPRTNRSRPATNKPLPIPQGNTPFISAIQPNSGVAGQSVTISGARLVSSDGSIVAVFGNAFAPTACRSEQQCVATVPSNPSGQPAALVRLRTAVGYSNGLKFRYR